MQETLRVKTRPVDRQYQLSMTDMQIETFTPIDDGLLVSGTTRFSMALDSDSSGSTFIHYVVPEFRKEMSGIFTIEPDADVIELKEVPIEDAKKAIYSYLKSKPGARTSDIILDLGFDPNIVVEALSQLKSEDKVEGRAIDGK